MSGLENIERFGQYAHGLEPEENGEFVRFSDVQSEIERADHLFDRNGRPPLTKEEMARFRADYPMDHLARIALAAWVNVRPDQLPKEMQAHTCPATMQAWGRVAAAIRKATTEPTT